MDKQTIRDWRGKIAGFVYTYPNGDKKATDWRGKIVGYYKKLGDKTTDERGRIITRGDTVISLIDMVNIK